MLVSVLLFFKCIDVTGAGLWRGIYVLIMPVGGGECWCR